MGLGDHPKTFLLKALCCRATPSWLKVVGWVVGGPGHFTVSTGTVSILDSRFPVPSPSPSRLTKKLSDIVIVDYTPGHLLAP